MDPRRRYGWVANPYGKSSLIPLPAGTFTPQDAPSLSRQKAHLPEKAELLRVRWSEWLGAFLMQNLFSMFLT